MPFFLLHRLTSVPPVFRRITRQLPALLFLAFLPLLLTGCRSSGSGQARDHTPQVRLPRADGKQTYESGGLTIDASHLDDGYFCASYSGDAPKVKLQLTGPDAITYTYDLTVSGETDTFPLTAGSGSYTLMAYENISGNRYSTALIQTLEVDLKDEFSPFLYPNQFVNYNKKTEAVQLASTLTADCSADLDTVTAIYNYVTENITYDYDKAKQANNGDLAGYLPDLDDTLRTKSGICFDYAALMTCMLRTQGIPTKLQIGFSNAVKHAWISAYLEESGWVDSIIRFDGKNWSLMDPTFASTMGNGADLKSFIGDGTNYEVQYSR
ncbi:MAG: transglutaminase-like domain-containing protein [Candidatus Limivivens sp.]|nr:transglutaminase-like domain-containing protein [Candidatus Limivivens sp.]